MKTRKFYVYVAIGILIFSIFAVFSYAAREKLDDEKANPGILSPEEKSKQSQIYAFSKIGSMIGFIIALVPSVRILQYSLVK
jgi:hypothetical protein